MTKRDIADVRKIIEKNLPHATIEESKVKYELFRIRTESCGIIVYIYTASTGNTLARQRLMYVKDVGGAAKDVFDLGLAVRNFGMARYELEQAKRYVGEWVERHK